MAFSLTYFSDRILVWGPQVRLCLEGRGPPVQLILACVACLPLCLGRIHCPFSEAQKEVWFSGKDTELESIT